jgi:hypothetical protein
MVFAEKSYGRLETTPLLEKTRDEKKSSFGKKSSFAALLFLAILATVGYAHPAFTHSLLANNNSSAFLGNALFRGNSDRGLFVSPPKLGGEGGAVPKVVLSLACSPGSRIPFDVENYSNVVGAKLITKSMSSEFDFDSLGSSCIVWMGQDRQLRTLGASRWRATRDALCTRLQSRIRWAGRLR